MSEPDQALAAIIESCAPKTLVAVGARAQTLAHLWCEAHPESTALQLQPHEALGELKFKELQDLALVTDTLEQLNRSQGQTLLGQLRNYGTRQIAVLTPNNGDWGLQDFIGMGFRRQGQFEHQGDKQSLYTYNLASYNHKRDWNNPRFWANPEMWGKARW